MENPQAGYLEITTDSTNPMVVWWSPAGRETDAFTTKVENPAGWDENEWKICEKRESGLQNHVLSFEQFWETMAIAV